MKFSHSVANTVSKMQDLEVKKRTLHTSRDDRATSEQCLDPRTRLMLFKMLSNGMLDVIDGCLSTGKEANVYYAKAGKKSPTTTGVTEFAIKIYKTSILVFKDRDKYVSGEHRWRRGYCK
jgi:RIO kinase 1